jgi:predicted RNA-binding Zn ribbon-like protein
MTAPLSLSSAAHLPFKYVGGDPSLDLVNTVDWTARGPAEDRLTDFERLTRWAEGAGVITARQATQARSLALAQPRMAERAHREAVELRWQLRQLFVGVSRRERADVGGALQAFNDSLRPALSELTLALPSRGAVADAPLQWSWRGASERVDAILWPVLRAAADLLTSPEAAQIRECAGDDCGWMYVDRSRNGLRRWCQMETCGNREKARRRAARG